MKKANGFTLIELMVTLAVAGVLLAMAVPSFTMLVKSNRLTTQANELVSSINFARSEAIKRGKTISICRSADGTSCASSGGWEQGWIIFTDLNGNGDYDSGSSPPDVLLRVQDTLKGENTLRPSSGLTSSITLTFQGYSENSGTFVICYDRNRDGDTADAEDFKSGIGISVSLTGRVSTMDATDTSFSDCVTP